MGLRVRRNHLNGFVGIPSHDIPAMKRGANDTHDRKVEFPLPVGFQIGFPCLLLSCSSLKVHHLNYCQQMVASNHRKK